MSFPWLPRFAARGVERDRRFPVRPRPRPQHLTLQVLEDRTVPSLFGPPTLFAADYPDSVAVGDVNRDGNLDLATANGGRNNVSVLLGNGSGGFGPPASYGAGSQPNFVAVGDFNRDGNL